MANDYPRIEQAISYILHNVAHQPGLDDVARHIGLSPFHFQRLFRKWAGVSPKQFLEYLTVEYAKRMLRESNNIFDTADTLGLSSPARLHDQFVSLEAVTPGQYRSGGNGLEITYGVHTCPLGGLFMAISARGICKVSFIANQSIQRGLTELTHTWPNATLRQDDPVIHGKACALISAINSDNTQPLHLLVKGTNFQINVWKAMLKIPYGSLVSYLELAKQAGYPDAIRAASSAVAANPIAFLIPCHRVLRKTGHFGQYHWGEDRKRIMVGYEASQLKQKTDDTQAHNPVEIEALKSPSSDTR